MRDARQSVQLTVMGGVPDRVLQSVAGDSLLVVVGTPRIRKFSRKLVSRALTILAKM